jgi:hypothetical protein
VRGIVRIIVYLDWVASGCDWRRSMPTRTAARDVTYKWSFSGAAVRVGMAPGTRQDGGSERRARVWGGVGLVGVPTTHPTNLPRGAGVDAARLSNLSLFGQNTGREPGR